MKIRVGYELIYDFLQSTPVIMVLGVHFTRASDVIVPDYLTISPSVLPLPRCLRQLVQPHRRSSWPNALVGRWRRS